MVSNWKAPEERIFHQSASYARHIHAKMSACDLIDKFTVLKVYTRSQKETVQQKAFSSKVDLGQTFQYTMQFIVNLDNEAVYPLIPRRHVFFLVPGVSNSPVPLSSSSHLVPLNHSHISHHHVSVSASNKTQHLLSFSVKSIDIVEERLCPFSLAFCRGRQMWKSSHQKAEHRQSTLRCSS